MSLQSHSNELYFKRIARQQAHGVILHYDAQAQALRPWYWPLKRSGERVPPSEFDDYRATHEFTTPLCFCAESGSVRVETSVYVAVEGTYWGEYVAGCAVGRCDYLVGIERLYPIYGLLAMVYPDAATTLNNSHRPGGNPASSLSASGISSLATYESPVDIAESTLNQLLKLDCHAKPGLSLAACRKLFVKCRRCDIIMTRRVMAQHDCYETFIDLTLGEENAAAPHHVIDLTADSEAEDSM